MNWNANPFVKIHPIDEFSYTVFDQGFQILKLSELVKFYCEQYLKSRDLYYALYISELSHRIDKTTIDEINPRIRNIVSDVTKSEKFCLPTNRR